MGEYFSPVLAQENWTLEGYYYSHSFGTWYGPEDGFRDHTCFGIGSKLIEHCYVGNKLVDAVCSWLSRKPMRVGWVGDYTAAVPPQLPDNLVDAVWGDKKIPGIWFHELPVPDHEVCQEAYLVNRTAKAAVWIPKKERFTVHPLPILTTTDQAPMYCPADHEVEYYIGAWVWDVLSIEQEVPKGYDVLDICFDEAKEE